jgi:hypothetical protein
VKSARLNVEFTGLTMLSISLSVTRTMSGVPMVPRIVTLDLFEIDPSRGSSIEIDVFWVEIAPVVVGRLVPLFD